MKDYTIELGGETRRLRYNMNAISVVEDSFGIRIDEFDQVDLGMKELRTMLWAGLLHEDRNLEEWAVGELVDRENYDEVQEVVVRAWADHVYGSAEGNGAAPEAGTGSE